MSQMDLLPDIPRYLTAIAECSSSILFAYIISKKVNFQWGLTATFLGIIQLILQFVAGALPIMYWIPGMLINIFWMGMTIHILTKLPMFSKVFMLAKAFILSELMTSSTWLLYCLLIFNAGISNVLLEIIFNLVIYCLFLGGMYLLEDKEFMNYDVAYYSWKDTLTSFLLVAITFAMSNIGFLLSSTAFNLGNSLAVFSLRMFVNMSGLCLVYIQQYLKKDHYHRREIDNMNHLFESQYQQYKTYAESTDYINRKAHDLKHQMNILLAEPNLMKRDEYLSKLQSYINNIDIKIETGNGVLDTFLTQKNQACVKKKINFTCIADGQLLEKMHVMDQVSLIGNALDNAIEHVEKILEFEKRLITLKLVRKNDMVVLRIDNYCIDLVDTVDGLPKTTKENTFYHGYGLKSIQYIAEKYHGNMVLCIEDNWFSLQVIFPEIV